MFECTSRERFVCCNFLRSARIVEMSVLDENSKTFLRQMDIEEVGKDFWVRMKKGGVETSIWRRGQTAPYTVGVAMGPTEATSFEALVLEVDKTYLGIFQENMNGIPVFLKFKFNSELQYFTSGHIDWNSEQKKFIVRLGQPFFVTTKRSACRYVSTDVDRIRLSIAGHAFDCYDISSGGFSTLVQTAKYAGMEKGSVFEKAELKYNLKKFIIPKVRLVNIIENKEQPDWIRLAFKFEGMRTSEEDALWVEVNKSVKRLADLLG